MRSSLALALAAAAAWLAAGAAGAEQPLMQELGVPPVIVHASPERARLAADLGRRGAADIGRLEERLGLEAPARIDVWLLPRKGEREPEEFGLPAGPAWASGLALHDRPVVILRTDDDGPGSRLATTLTHELVHAIMAAGLSSPRVQARVPAWWHEGVAAHLASEWRLVESAHAAGLALTGSFLPLEQIEDEFPAGGARVQWAYLESFAFLGWLEERAGPDAIARVHRRLLEGQSFRGAFVEVFGTSPARLEEEWKEAFLWRHRWIPLVTSSSTLWCGVVIAFVAAGLVKRRRAARRMKAWEDEEAALAGEMAAVPGETDAVPGETNAVPGETDAVPGDEPPDEPIEDDPAR